MVEKKTRLKTRLTLNCKHSLFDDNSNCKYCIEADKVAYLPIS